MNEEMVAATGSFVLYLCSIVKASVIRSSTVVEPWTKSCTQLTHRS